jgi:MFS family permease
MPPIPPTPLILATLQEYVLPAAGGAALTLALFLTMGRWAAALGSAAAVVVAFAWANFQFGPFEEDTKRFMWESSHRLISWKPNERYSWHYLPRAALVLVVVGLVSRWLGLLVGRFLPERRWWVQKSFVWLPRWIAVVMVGSWVIPAPWAEAHSWLRPALGAAMLVSWFALDGMARRGAGSQAALALAAMFFAAGGVAIYAHSQLFMNIAIVMGCAMFGIAAAAGSAKADTSGAIPAGVGFLPAFMLNVRDPSESLVPLAGFWLVGLAPLMLLPFLIPRIARQPRWIIIPLRIALVLIPLVLAITLAMKYEQLPPEEEW